MLGSATTCNGEYPGVGPSASAIVGGIGISSKGSLCSGTVYVRLVLSLPGTTIPILLLLWSLKSKEKLDRVSIRDKPKKVGKVDLLFGSNFFMYEKLVSDILKTE